MTERSDVYAYFWVEGYAGSHDEISVRLKLNPTATRNIGDVGRYGSPAKCNGCEFWSPLPRGGGLLQEYLEALVGLLEPVAPCVREIAFEYSAGINCVGYYYGVNPGLHLSSDLLMRVAALHVSVDFDLYNYSASDAA